ncbi:unnamed protein product [Pocillopora meandrina]|uniref:Uncharacterized protein n=1 Tax=Pocillopora meandrina TaxID=46732 RepID=A0AAU9WGG6_9CNID|nr:unnamed protein product [Pocillopora meandrina]
MPRKRKHSSEEEEEEAEEVENNIRAKRRAAVEARDRVAAKEGASDDEDEEDDLDEEEDDDKDEDYEGEGVGDEEGDEEGDEDDEEEEENDGAGGAEGEDDDEDDEEVEDEEQEPDTVECILADLEEPTSDTPGYVLKKKDSPKKMELCFMGEMRETLVDVTEAFQAHFEEKKLPVLQITKFDMIGDTNDTTQVDVLEIKYDKAYGIRELDDDSDDILSQNFYCVVRVEGIEGTWATQYFLPEPED